MRALVPPENLLEYRMGEGWQPLCDFLGAPVPEGQKFPHTNDTEGFVDRCRRRNRAQLMNVLFRATVMSGTVAALIFSATFTVRKFVGFGRAVLA